MKTRLQQLINKEGINPARFAEIVGVQRSSVSHILSGRNNPSLDFIQKILIAFPKVSSDWLISGLGNIYRENQLQNKGIQAPEKFNNKSDNGDLFSVIQEENKPIYGISAPISPSGLIDSSKPLSDLLSSDSSIQEETSKNEAKKNKQIERIVVFYANQTFKEYVPE